MRAKREFEESVKHRMAGKGEFAYEPARDGQREEGGGAGVKGIWGEMKNNVKGVVGKGKESMDRRKEAGERERLRRYEEKRQLELKQERWEAEEKRREERALRKKL